VLLRLLLPPPPPLPLQTWSGKQDQWDAAQKILVALAKANSEAQLGQFKGPHPVPGMRRGRGEDALQGGQCGGRAGQIACWCSWWFACWAAN